MGSNSELWRSTATRLALDVVNLRKAGTVCVGQSNTPARSPTEKRVSLHRALTVMASVAASAACSSASAYEFGSPGGQQKPGVVIGAAAAAPPPGLYGFEQAFTYQSKIAGPGAPNVSTRSLYRFFARHDLRPSAWLLNLRLEEARRRLSCPSARTSITQIAFEAGFNDASHFSKMFRQAFGFTPTEYRAETRRDGRPGTSAASQASPGLLGRQHRLAMENMEDPADRIGLQ